MLGEHPSSRRPLFLAHALYPDSPLVSIITFHTCALEERAESRDSALVRYPRVLLIQRRSNRVIGEAATEFETLGLSSEAKRLTRLSFVAREARRDISANEKRSVWHE